MKQEIYFLLCGEEIKAELLLPEDFGKEWFTLQIAERFKSECKSIGIFGYEAFEQKKSNPLRVIRSIDVDQENKRILLHISVSKQHSLPSWEDLVMVKETFSGKESRMFQCLPPRSEWVNSHPYTLHLWGVIYGKDTLDSDKLWSV